MFVHPLIVLALVVCSLGAGAATELYGWGPYAAGMGSQAEHVRMATNTPAGFQTPQLVGWLKEAYGNGTLVAVHTMCDPDVIVRMCYTVAAFEDGVLARWSSDGLPTYFVGATVGAGSIDTFFRDRGEAFVRIPTMSSSVSPSPCLWLETTGGWWWLGNVFDSSTWVPFNWFAVNGHVIAHFWPIEYYAGSIGDQAVVVLTTANRVFFYGREYAGSEFCTDGTTTDVYAVPTELTFFNDHGIVLDHLFSAAPRYLWPSLPSAITYFHAANGSVYGCGYFKAAGYAIPPPQPVAVGQHLYEAHPSPSFDPVAIPAYTGKTVGRMRHRGNALLHWWEPGMAVTTTTGDTFYPNVFPNSTQWFTSPSDNPSYGHYDAGCYGFVVDGALYMGPKDVYGCTGACPDYRCDSTEYRLVPFFNESRIYVRAISYRDTPFAIVPPVCDPGVDSAPLSQCHTCPPGTFVDTTAFSLPGVNNCTFCPEGHNSSTWHAPSCARCPAGHYQDVIGQTECKFCPPNTQRNATAPAAACVQCPVHHAWSPTHPPASLCLPCPAGLHRPPGTPGTACVPCPGGHTSQPGGPCVACPPGTYGDVVGVAQCLPCPHSTYSGVPAAVGVAACTACPTFAYSPPTSTNISACSCNDGISALDDPLLPSACLCPPHFFRLPSGDCAHCSASSYKTTWGNVACDFCPPYAATLPDGSGCACRSSFTTSHAAATGELECLCGPGTELLSGECVSCSLAHAKPDVGNAPCSSCPERSQGSDDRTACECVVGTYAVVPGVVDSCTPCPDNTFCLGAASVPMARPGFWVARNAHGMARAYECKPDDACAGGIARCATGYAPNSTLCANCVPGFVKQLSGRCLSCTGGSSAFVLVYALGAVAFALFALFSGNSGSSAYLMILLNALQIAAQASTPNLMVHSLISFTDFNIAESLLGRLCSVNTSWESMWLLSMLIPLFLIATVAVVGPVLLLLPSRALAWVPRERGARLRFVANGMITAVLLTTIHAIRTAFVMISCWSVGTATVLRAHGGIACYSDTHMPYYVAAWVLLIAFGAGLAAVLALSFRRIRTAQTPAARAAAAASAPVLFAAYRPTSYWWEAVIVCRRVAATIAAQLSLGLEPTVRMLVLALVVQAFAVMHTAKHPFAEHLANRTEVGVLAVLVFTFFLFGIVHREPTSTAGAIADVMATVVVASLILYIVVGIRIFRHLAARHDSRADAKSPSALLSTVTPWANLATDSGTDDPLLLAPMDSSAGVTSSLSQPSSLSSAPSSSSASSTTDPHAMRDVAY